MAPPAAERAFGTAKWWGELLIQACFRYPTPSLRTSFKAPKQKWTTPPKHTPEWWYAHNGTAPATKEAPPPSPADAKPVTVRDLHRRGAAFSRDISA